MKFIYLLFLCRDGLSAPRPTPKQGNQLCRLSAIIPYTRRNSPYLATVSSTLNLTMRHVAATNTQSSRIPALWLQWNQQQTNGVY